MFKFIFIIHFFSQPFVTGKVLNTGNSVFRQGRAKGDFIVHSRANQIALLLKPLASTEK